MTAVGDDVVGRGPGGRDTVDAIGAADTGLTDVSSPSDQDPGIADGGDGLPRSRDGDGAAEALTVAYELVFDCRDEVVGHSILRRIEEVVGPTWEVTRGEDGPTWSLTLEFPSQAAADRFFCSDFYSRICVEVRRQCVSALLVVPLGPVVDREA